MAHVNNRFFKQDGLGDDLRALRKSRGLTLTHVAQHLGRSVGWLSQVERGLSDPHIEELRKLAALFDVHISSLFRQNAPESERGIVVRKGARRPIGNKEAGLVEELLSPDLTDTFEVIHSTFEPGAQLGAPVSRATQEVGFIVSGRLELTVAAKTFQLGPGDSFRIRGQLYHWRNPHDVPCVVIWAIAPPIY